MDEKWTHEFIGLFWGEGCADIQKYQRDRGTFYRPRLRITMRMDEESMLKEIQLRLGGTLTAHNLRPGPSKEARTWALTQKEQIVKVCDLLLSGSLPAKKKHDVRLVREAADLRAGKLGHMAEAERKRLEELYWMCRKTKEFGNK